MFASHLDRLANSLANVRPAPSLRQLFRLFRVFFQKQAINCDMLDNLVNVGSQCSQHGQAPFEDIIGPTLSESVTVL